ncbi:cupin domain-containing protein [Azonexus hydrophilus]|uniref:cupin domain-containing protein n=1 Tax=Azonexus hydrophilus TaxID=418702 RepID=UPI0003F82DF5|nr:cupin domain-containing protein [Azonexus hydrophilus]
MPKLTVFARQSPAAAYDHPRPDRLVAGNPLRTTHEHFAAPQGDLVAGIWACEPGAWRIAFAEGKDEFFCIIEGRIRITDSDGEATEFGPGEAGVIPAGFTGTFAVLEAVRKHYVVLERAAGSGL